MAGGLRMGEGNGRRMVRFIASGLSVLVSGAVAPPFMGVGGTGHRSTPDPRPASSAAQQRLALGRAGVASPAESRPAATAAAAAASAPGALLATSALPATIVASVHTVNSRARAGETRRSSRASAKYRFYPCPGAVLR